MRLFRRYTHYCNEIQRISYGTLLTTASFGKEDLVKRSVVNSDVIVAGASRGRTVKAENGRPVDLVYHVDRDAFFDYITDLAKK